MTSPAALAARALPWEAPTTWIAILAALVFLMLGARAVLAPRGASAFFGVALDDGGGLAFVQAFGARNMALALTALALVALDQRLALAALLLAAALVAGVDALAVRAQAGPAKAAKHLAYLVALGGFAGWLGLS